jgi:hypothetical protein
VRLAAIFFIAQFKIVGALDYYRQLSKKVVDGGQAIHLIFH